MLILLAGVTVSLLVGDSGVITKAKQGKTNMTNAQGEEQTGLDQLYEELLAGEGEQEEGYEQEIANFQMAQRNLMDGGALIQTASGAFTEMQNMLQYVNELVMSVIRDSSADKESIQSQIDALIPTELDLSTQVEFNGVKLLDGTLQDENAWKVDVVSRKIPIEIPNMTSSGLNCTSLSVATTEEANTSQQAIANALNRIGEEITRLGAQREMFEMLESYYGSLNNVLANNLAVEETKKQLAVEGMKSILATLQRINEKELQAQTLGQTDREFIAPGINQLKEMINIIAEDLSLKGQKLLNGSFLEIPNLNSVGLGKNGEELFTDITTDANITESIAQSQEAITKVNTLIESMK